MERVALLSREPDVTARRRSVCRPPRRRRHRRDAGAARRAGAASLDDAVRDRVVEVLAETQLEHLPHGGAARRSRATRCARASRSTGCGRGQTPRPSRRRGPSGARRGPSAEPAPPPAAPAAGLAPRRRGGARVGTAADRRCCAPCCVAPEAPDALLETQPRARGCCSTRSTASAGRSRDAAPTGIARGLRRSTRPRTRPSRAGHAAMAIVNGRRAAPDRRPARGPRCHRCAVHTGPILVGLGARTPRARPGEPAARALLVLNGLLSARARRHRDWSASRPRRS